MDAELDAHRSEIAGMLIELADACEGFCARSETLCVLGM
jgi:hypothetical protein